MGGEDRVVWGELRMLIEDAYRMVAPKKLIDQLHGQP
jgi:hypothetical protein